MEYTGEKLFLGKSGAFKIVQQDSAESVIKIFLKSTPSYEDEEYGEYQEMSLLDRTNADITIGIAYDDIDELWETSNLNVETLGLAGVNEFMLALFEHQDQLSTVEDIVEVLMDLLSQTEVIWGVDYL